MDENLLNNAPSPNIQNKIMSNQNSLNAQTINSEINKQNNPVKVGKNIFFITLFSALVPVLVGFLIFFTYENNFSIASISEFFELFGEFFLIGNLIAFLPLFGIINLTFGGIYFKKDKRASKILLILGICALVAYGLCWASISSGLLF